METKSTGIYTVGSNMRIPTKHLTLLTMLTSVSVIGRVYVSFLPNIQPTTAIIVITSLAFGPSYGFLVAVLSAILSNLYLGMGTWTIGQIIAWGLIGILAGLLRKFLLKRSVLIVSIFSALCGLLFGLIMSIWSSVLTSFSFIPYYLAGLPFDLNHAVSNFICYFMLAPILIPLIKKQISK